MKRIALAVAVVLGMSLAGKAQAQSCTTSPSCSVNASVSVTVPQILRLTLSTTSATLTAPTETDFDAGHLQEAGASLTATVKSNKPWNLSVKSNAANWDTAPWSKPASDLQWSKTNGSGYAGLTTGAANVYSANQGATGNGLTSFFFNTLYSYANDVPGAYSITVIFTVTAP